jgi:predicted RNase H-like nuclease
MIIVLNKIVFISECTNLLKNTSQNIKYRDIKIIELEMLINNVNNTTRFGILEYICLSN